VGGGITAHSRSIITRHEINARTCRASIAGGKWLSILLAVKTRSMASNACSGPIL
jgi:hypothetical protein